MGKEPQAGSVGKGLAAAMAAGEPDCLRWRLIGDELPSLALALSVGERFKAAVLGTVEAALGHRPSELDPHEGDGPARGHLHPFYLPEDADGDGRIDHVLMYAPRGLPADWRQVLGMIRPAAVLDGSLPPFEPVPEWLGHRAGGALPGKLLGPARVWRTATPYVPNLHLKTKLAAADVLRRELGWRDLPPCEIDALHGEQAWPPGLGRDEFVIRRLGLDSPRAARQSASGQRFAFRLRFAEPVRGPLAFGFACHLGLGLFRRDTAPSDSPVNIYVR